MNFRKAFLFIVSLVLTCGIVLAQQGAPAPPSAPAPPAPGVFGWSGDDLGSFSLFIEGGSFLGVHAEDINKENMARYNMREARGVGITEVVKDSPAEKAGLRKGDVIVRFEGDSVTSVRKLTRLVSEVAPDQTARLTISRSGGEQEVSVTIAKRDNKINAFQTLEGLKGFEGFKKLEGMDKLHKLFPPDGTPGAKTWKWGGPGEDGMVFSLGNHRRIGVSTMQLTKQLADYFGIADGKGVLVTAITDDGPAAKAGLKAGDVITAIDGEKVEGAGELSRTINKKKDGDVTLTIVRNKNQRTITVTPKAAESLLKPGTIRQAGGRTIVIPRIELGSIPAVNVSVPQISLPVIPEINIQVPGKIVKPRVIRTRTSQPI